MLLSISCWQSRVLLIVSFLAAGNVTSFIWIHFNTHTKFVACKYIVFFYIEDWGIQQVVGWLLHSKLMYIEFSVSEIATEVTVDYYSRSSCVCTSIHTCVHTSAGTFMSPQMDILSPCFTNNCQWCVSWQVAT